MKNKRRWIIQSLKISLPIILLLSLVIVVKAGAISSTVTDSFNDENKIASKVGVTVNTSNGIIHLAESSSWSCGDTLTDARDGNTYSTVLIGTQCWTSQNINYGTLTAGANSQGASCPSVAETEKYCYGDSEANCDTYGALYQYDQVMCGASSCNGTGEGQTACTTPVQGICPAGWHVPSHYEFTQLEREVCDSGTCATDFPYDTTATGWRGTDEGTKLKTGGSSGFEGLLAGYRYTNGSFYNLGPYAHFWSSLESGSNAWDRFLSSGYAAVYRSALSQSNGLSARCLKD